MKTIYKEPLTITDKQTFVCPGKFLAVTHVGLDPQGVPCIWFALERGYPDTKITVYVVGTGHPLPDGNCMHVGSFVQSPFVWHIFIEEN